MSSARKRRVKQATLTLDLGPDHLTLLDNLVGICQGFAPQVEQFLYKRVTRSTVARAALVLLRNAIRLGSSGPEVLLLGIRGKAAMRRGKGGSTSEVA